MTTTTTTTTTTATTLKTTIRPGLLVALKTSVSGGVEYERKDLEKNDETGTSRWETTRHVVSPEEHDAARKARAAAQREIRAVCSPTSFGLICPESVEAELDAAIARAHEIRDRHNEAAKNTRIEVFVLKGRIASTDEQAARAIGSEISGLIEGMSSAIDRLDVNAIREAASRASELEAVLAADKAEAVASAVAAARKAARVIVARVQKGGEDAAIVLSDIQRGGIQRARLALAELAVEAPSGGDAEPTPAFEVQRAAGIEIEPTPAAAESTQIGGA